MFCNFIFKKIRYSPLKFRLIINRIKHFSINNILIYLNFLNFKSSFILLKFFNSSLNSLIKKFNTSLNFISLKKISSETGGYLKRIFIRSKGRFDIIKKPYTNLIFLYFIDNII